MHHIECAAYWISNPDAFIAIEKLPKATNESSFRAIVSVL